MSELTKAANNLIKAWEDAELNITLLSFLVLDYHISMQVNETRNEVLMHIYGLTPDQLDDCYADLEFAGYVIDKGEFISITGKANQAFNRRIKRMSQGEKNSLEYDFERFWKLFPRKAGKKKALFEWMRLRPDKNAIEYILKSLRNQIKWKKQEEAKFNFVPEFQDAERWLRNARYDDEYTLDKPKININTKPDRDER
tara:strand:+ start:301 stop:894 length:594 start_codon:yes stop_codon:yes gene_type:complete